MSVIDKINAREVLDSRGNPTVEAEIRTKDGISRAMVPSGASTGVYEALELRDNDRTRYMGKGVLKALGNIKGPLAECVLGMDPAEQQEIDAAMIELDGTENKGRLGANAILAVSMAACKAGAAADGIALYKHIASLAGVKKFMLPTPCFNIINGGVHAGNELAIQEFMIAPTGAPNFHEALRMASEVYHTLKKVIKGKYGIDATNVGDEGGFAPNLKDGGEALELLSNAIGEAGYAKLIKVGIDSAASEFFVDGKYDLGFKSPGSRKGQLRSGDDMIDLYREFVKQYDIAFIEDPFAQDDWGNFTKLTAAVGGAVEIVGDDLLVTNPVRIRAAVEKRAVNGLLLKVNQIGTITESITASKMAKAAGWGVLVSHRSGETEDPFIADLSVGINAGHIKSGAPCRSERLAKYNQLMRIEEELGSDCGYAGKGFRRP